MNSTATRLLMLGEAAARCGVVVWQVQAVIDKGLFTPRRAGRYRVVEEWELPALRDALVRCGYLPGDGLTGLTGEAGPAAIEG